MAKLDYRISSGDEARKLDGIGDKISKKIDEFISTGKLDKLEKVYLVALFRIRKLTINFCLDNAIRCILVFLILQIRSDDSNTAINLLTRVAGIGPAKAHSLVDSGITTILELRDPSNQVVYRYSLDVPFKYYSNDNTLSNSLFSVIFYISIF